MSQASQAGAISRGVNRREEVSPPAGARRREANRREEVSPQAGARLRLANRREEVSPQPEANLPLADEIDVKPKLNLRIIHDELAITVRVKANMLFKKIFDAAAQRFDKEPGTLRFHYSEIRIKPNDTPAGLGMEDDDQLDAYVEQLGGGSLAISP